VAAAAARAPAPSAGAPRDDVVLTVAFSGGSVATIVYHAMGDPSLPKERVEVVRGDRAATIDDFRTVTLSRGGKTVRTKAAQDKGHRAEAAAFVKAVRAGGPPPIPYADLLAVTRATFAAVAAVGSGRFEDA
jgi:predicted dehydrogenase